MISRSSHKPGKALAHGIPCPGSFYLYLKNCYRLSECLSNAERYLIGLIGYGIDLILLLPSPSITIMVDISVISMTNIWSQVDNTNSPIDQ